MDALARERVLALAGIVTPRVVETETRGHPHPGQQYHHGWVPVEGAIVRKTVKLGGTEIGISVHPDRSRTLDFPGGRSVHLERHELSGNYKARGNLRAMSYDVVDGQPGEGDALSRVVDTPSGGARKELLLGVKKVAEAPDEHPTIPGEETWDLTPVSLHLPPNDDPSYDELMASPPVATMRQRDLTTLAEMDIPASRVDLGAGRSVDVFRDGGKFTIRPAGSDGVTLDSRATKALGGAISDLWNDDGRDLRPATEVVERTVSTKAGDFTVRMTGEGEHLQISGPGLSLDVDKDHLLEFVSALGDLTDSASATRALPGASEDWEERAPIEDEADDEVDERVEDTDGVEAGPARSAIDRDRESFGQDLGETRDCDDTETRHRALALLGIPVIPLPPDNDNTIDGETRTILDALDEWVERQVDEDWEERGDVSKELRIPGGKGGGRWTANPVGKAISDALDAWGKGKGPDDPFTFDGKPIDREPLRKAAVARGITLKRGASRDDIVHALLGGVRDEVKTQRAERQKRLGSAKFSINVGGKVDPEAAREVEVENKIRAIYEELPKAPGGWVGLADLRDRLAEENMRTTEVDAALRRLSREAGVNVTPVANVKALKPRDHAAAVRIGEDQNHMIRIDDPSPRPMPTPVGGKKIDVAVYRADSKPDAPILREVSSANRPGRAVTIQPDMAGLERTGRSQSGHEQKPRARRGPIRPTPVGASPRPRRGSGCTATSRCRPRAHRRHRRRSPRRPQAPKRRNPMTSRRG